jgi:hypothetical protein
MRTKPFERIKSAAIKTAAAVGVGIAASLMTPAKPAEAQQPYYYNRPPARVVVQPYYRPPNLVIEAQRNPYSESVHIGTRHSDLFLWRGQSAPAPAYYPGYAPGPAYRTPCGPPIFDPEGILAPRSSVGVIEVPVVVQQPVYVAPQIPAPVTTTTQPVTTTNSYNTTTNNTYNYYCTTPQAPAQPVQPAPTMQPQTKQLPQTQKQPYVFHYGRNELIRDVEQTKAQIGRMIDYFLFTDDRFAGKGLSYTQDIRLYGGIAGDIGVTDPAGRVKAVFELTYDESPTHQSRVNRVLNSAYHDRTFLIDVPKTELQLYSYVSNAMDNLARN